MYPKSFQGLFLFCCLIVKVPSVWNYEKLIVISYDGFRYDYLERNLTPYLNSLKQTGTNGKFMINVFPTQTFTNHFTIATGLYSEVHCVIGSSVYDSVNKVVLSYSYPLFHYNDKILPIWILNERTGSGRHSGVMMWPGSDFKYDGTNVTFMKKYDSQFSWEQRVDMVIGWLKHPQTPANLIMMYFEQPDKNGHIYGPNSAQTDSQIRRADKITEYLVESLKKNGLVDVNVIFLSDHGMDGVTKNDVIDLKKLVGNECDMYGTSPVLQIYPKPGFSVDSVFQKLHQSASSVNTFKVFRRENIPDHFHYKTCGRAPPILAVAEPGHAFQDLYDMIEEYKILYNVSENGVFGVHGYDPNVIKMHPYFIAVGPIFKKNYTVKNKIEIIDLYPLFLQLLDLQMPPIKPNGTISQISEILLSDHNKVRNALIIVMCVVTGLIVLIPLVMLLKPFIGNVDKNCPISSSCISRGCSRNKIDDSLLEKQELLMVEET